MNLLFKNITRYNKNIYMEFLRFHRDKYHFSYVLYTLIIIVSILFCFIVNINYHNYFIAFLFAIILACFIFWRYFKPVSQVKKSFSSEEIRLEKEYIFSFYEKKFKISNNKKYEIIPYTQLYKIFETKDFFYFYIDKTHSYLISKSGFTKGTSSEFSNFIKKKCLFKYKLTSKK